MSSEDERPRGDDASEPRIVFTPSGKRGRFPVGTPVLTATVGQQYECRAAVVRSIGDLRVRVVEGRTLTGFWDIEEPSFTLKKGPAWLSIDGATGVLSGTPDAPGRAAVEVAVTLSREELELDPNALSWGQHKVTGTHTKTLGPATMEFGIEVAP